MWFTQELTILVLSGTFDEGTFEGDEVVGEEKRRRRHWRLLCAERVAEKDDGEGGMS